MTLNLQSISGQLLLHLGLIIYFTGCMAESKNSNMVLLTQIPVPDPFLAAGPDGITFCGDIRIGDLSNNGRSTFWFIGLQMMRTTAAEICSHLRKRKWTRAEAIPTYFPPIQRATDGLGHWCHHQCYSRSIYYQALPIPPRCRSLKSRQ
jgi:hypothetical protein